LPWLLLTFASVFALGKAYGAIHRVQVVGVLPDTVGGVLMAVGSLFAALLTGRPRRFLVATAERRIAVCCGYLAM
jgi:hypothetical protein